MPKWISRTGLIVALVVFFAGFVYGSWRVSRWFNWEFSYGGRVEQRLVELEARVSALEEML